MYVFTHVYISIIAPNATATPTPPHPNHPHPPNPLSPLLPTPSPLSAEKVRSQLKK